MEIEQKADLDVNLTSACKIQATSCAAVRGDLCVRFPCLHLDFLDAQKYITTWQTILDLPPPQNLEAISAQKRSMQGREATTSSRKRNAMCMLNSPRSISRVSFWYSTTSTPQKKLLGLGYATAVSNATRRIFQFENPPWKMPDLRKMQSSS